MKIKIMLPTFSIIFILYNIQDNTQNTDLNKFYSLYMVFWWALPTNFFLVCGKNWLQS